MKALFENYWKRVFWALLGTLPAAAFLYFILGSSAWALIWVACAFAVPPSLTYVQQSEWSSRQKLKVGKLILSGLVSPAFPAVLIGSWVMYWFVEFYNWLGEV